MVVIPSGCNPSHLVDRAASLAWEVFGVLGCADDRSRPRLRPGPPRRDGVEPGPAATPAGPTSPLLPDGEAQARALAPACRPSTSSPSWPAPCPGPDRPPSWPASGTAWRSNPTWSSGTTAPTRGSPPRQIREERPGWDLFADGVPHGESIQEVAARVDRVIARIRAAPGDVACVAHAHVLRVLAARWIGLDPVVGRSLILDPAAAACWVRTASSRSLDAWNTPMQSPPGR